jgi:LuxR family maltose regulon positive regulatory protein
MVEIMDSPLVLTKLCVPAVRSRCISRAHLLDRRTPLAGAGLVLVCAPAGYGKTTLLAEWAHALRQQGAAAAWYALDTGDDNPVTFGTYLAESLVQALGPTPGLAKAAQHLRSSPESDLRTVLPAAIHAAAACGRACWLILDDYHLIGAPAVHAAVAYLLEHRPENLHLALGSRSDPPLPLARLRARGQLVELRASDLRFTPDETRQFLHEVMQLDLPPELAAALEERTEGWAAGLQLAALSLSGRADKETFLGSVLGSHRYLVDYLLEEVLHQQPQEVQDFLLCTSILERLCAPLCDAVLESGEWRVESGDHSPLSTLHSQVLLESLDRANLFLIPLDEERRWYRYHHLFRDFLQTRLRKTRPELEERLHRAACEWCARRSAPSGTAGAAAGSEASGGAGGTLHEAARHAFQTRDWEYAAAFVEQHAFTLIVHSDMATIYEWCSQFPEEVMQAHPMLCIHQCWPWVMRFRRENRGKIERRLLQAEQAAAHTDPQLAGEVAAGEVAAAATVIRTLQAMAPDPAADPRELLARTRSALSRLPVGAAPSEGQFSDLLMSGYAHLALQEARAAAESLEMARQVALDGRLYFGIVESTFHRARLAHSQGQLRRAAEMCREGQADIAGLLAHPEQELPAVGCLDIALGSLLLEQDLLEEAERRLLRGLDLVGWRMNTSYPMAACTALARLREIQGRPAEAAAFLTRLEEGWPDIAFCTQGLRMALSLRTASHGMEDPASAAASAAADAAAWYQAFPVALESDPYLPGIGPFGGAEVYYLASLAWVRLQIAAGNARAALPYLERHLDRAASQGLAARVIELSLLEAQALASTRAAPGQAPLGSTAGGGEQRLWTALERALAAAQAEGFVRSFDQGPALARLLVEAGRRGMHPEFIGRVLSAITRPSTGAAGGKGQAEWQGERQVVQSGAASRSSPAANLPGGERLSERELEVLRLMACGATNQAIAWQLVITVGTVKSHINHILGKLEAHNRTEAVRRAQLLGLIEI